MHKTIKSSFLKWAGGKKRLVNEFNKFLPKSMDRYFEPFLGSGAFFFYLVQTQKKFKAILSDSNYELINAYTNVRDNPKELIEILYEHQINYYKNREKYYYFIRDQYNIKNNIDLAARFIFLNKACYNGLYRVNRSGNFNVPHGKYLNPKICNKEKLLDCSELLRSHSVEITCSGYKNTISKCENNDFIYLDPPYFPVTKTANFTDYTKENFGMQEHNELAKEFDRLNNIGAKVILSNSNSEYIKTLYKKYEIIKIKSNRNINCDPKKRKNHYDLIILNYNQKLVNKKIISEFASN
ncbi:MAG TPA: Dam family site-specific DNA-(adenine-N6)-methyltransferase [Candidatus Nitrosocosmicus sp.]